MSDVPTHTSNRLITVRMGMGKALAAGEFNLDIFLLVFLRA